MNQKSREIKKLCQYNYPNCQNLGKFQQIIKLGSVTIGKRWTCANCRQIIEQQRKNYEK